MAKCQCFACPHEPTEVDPDGLLWCEQHNREWSSRPLKIKLHARPKSFVYKRRYQAPAFRNVA